MPSRILPLLPAAREAQLCDATKATPMSASLIAERPLATLVGYYARPGSMNEP